MPAPRLSNLPDLCLLAIFKYLTLNELIRHIGLVCPNWARVQRDELRRRGHSTKHLVIVQNNVTYFEENEIRKQENPYGSDLIELVLDDDGLPWARIEPPQQDVFNTLRVPGDVLTETFTAPVINLLPNITHLTIFQIINSPIESLVTSLEQIVRLLNHYAPKLISLKLHFTSYISIQTHHYNHESSVRALFNAINRLNSLQHLSLNIYFSYYQTQSKLRILSRLSTLTIHNFEPSSMLFDSLREYATAGDVRINCGPLLEMALMKAMVRMDPQLANRFTRASISKASAPTFFIDYDITQLFCVRFISLITLDVCIHTIPMTMLSQCLSQLPQLVCVNLGYWSALEEEERSPQPEIAQIPSVRLLTLTAHTKSHHDTERLHLHQIFPNLQMLHLIHYSEKCSECQYESRYAHQKSMESELATRVAHCMCLARQPLRLCANLHTVKFDIQRIFPKFLSLPEELLTVDQWHAFDSHIIAQYKPSRSRHPIQLPSTIFSIIFNKILSYILFLLYICKLVKKPHNS